MASFVVDNNVESLVADDPLTSGAVTLNVNTGHGARFPSTFPYRLTIWDDSTYPDPTDDSNMEVVNCTARSTDALTIARGEEGTSGVEHALGSRVALLFTAGLFNDATYGVSTKLDTIDTNADVTGDNPPQTHAMSTHTDEGALSTLNTVDTAQIDDDAVLYAKIQNIVNDERILGRVSGADGIVEELTATQVLAMIGVESGADVTDAFNVVQAWLGEADKNTPANDDTIPIADSAASNVMKKLKWSNLKATLKTYFDTLYNLYVHPNHSGDVTSVADGAQTIVADAVTYAKMQNVVNDERILGRVSGANGVVEELTAAQVLALINVEAAADVTDAANVDSAGAVMESDISDQSFTNLLKNGNFESWSAGASSAPDGWLASTSPTIAQESSIVKIGTYSCKITASAPASLLQSIIPNYEYYRGKTITAGVWIYSSKANASKIRIIDSVGYTQTYHSGTLGWEWITVSHSVDASATSLKVYLSPDSADGSDIAYFDGAILVEGSICPAFSPKPLSANDLTIHMQTPQTLTGAGAVDIITDITHIITTGADALTLIDGAEGQEKFIVMKTDANDGTLTPTNLGNGTTITFDDVGDSAHLIFTNGAWHFIGGTATLA